MISNESPCMNAYVDPTVSVQFIDRIDHLVLRIFRALYLGREMFGNSRFHSSQHQWPQQLHCTSSRHKPANTNASWGCLVECLYTPLNLKSIVVPSEIKHVSLCYRSSALTTRAMGTVIYSCLRYHYFIICATSLIVYHSYTTLS